MAELCPRILVKYSFLPADEGGKRRPPAQGYRPQWAYDPNDFPNEGHYIPWIRFLNEAGEPHQEGDAVPLQGVATLEFFDQELWQEVHQHRMKPGLKGFFAEGRWFTAEVEVLSVARQEQPTSNG